MTAVADPVLLFIAKYILFSLGLSLLNPMMPGVIKISSSVVDVKTSAMTPLPGNGSFPRLLEASAVLFAASQ